MPRHLSHSPCRSLLLGLLGAALWACPGPPQAQRHATKPVEASTTAPAETATSAEPQTSSTGTAPHTTASAVPAPAQAVTFSVLSYNIYVGNRDLAEVVRLVNAADATVVCLQETIPSSQRVLGRDLAQGYPYQEFHTGRVGNGPGVLSKLPWSAGRYVPSTHGYNGYWIGQFVVAGQLVQLANVHLHPTIMASRSIRGALAGWSASEAIRVREIDQLVALLDPELPTVLAGDFNSPSSGGPYAHLVDLGFSDAFRDGPAPGRGTPTFRGRIGGLPVPVRIDYVWLRGGLRSVEGRVIADGSSDHYPVLATLRFAP